jgi:hypothetical protein
VEAPSLVAAGDGCVEVDVLRQLGLAVGFEP